MLFRLETEIQQLQGFRAGLLFSSYDNAIKSMADNFYEPIEKPIVIDKNRGWGTPYNWDNLSTYLNPKGKVILTMRPILEVLASFLQIAKATEKVTGQLPYVNNDLWVSHYRNKDDALIDNLMMPNGEIDRALFSIANLLHNHRENVCVIWLDDLVQSPQLTLSKIYTFLELPNFAHNFDNIKEVDKHDDLMGFGVVGLHDLEPKLTKSKTQPSKVLSNYVIGKYGNCLDFLNF
jgi:sulfotransferase